MTLLDAQKSTPKQPTLTTPTTSYDNAEISIQDCLNSTAFWLFIAAHLAAFIGLFIVPWSWSLVALCVASYYVRMLGVTSGYHRYFSHRSFAIRNRAIQFLMAAWAQSSMQKGVCWWASNHRHHHKHADTEFDLHSPTIMGFWWAHCGWFLVSKKHVSIQWHLIPDLKRYPELIWLEENHFVPGVLYMAILYIFGGLPVVYWGFLLSTVMLWHGTYTINSLSHVFGSRRFKTPDTSKNNFFLTLLTLGEGWHNNHHACATATKNGFFWWEIDPTYYFIWLASKVSVFSNIKTPNWETLEKKLIIKKE